MLALNVTGKEVMGVIKKRDIFDLKCQENQVTNLSVIGLRNSYSTDAIKTSFSGKNS